MSTKTPPIIIAVEAHCTWVLNGETYITDRAPVACPYCFHRAIVALPPPLLKKQKDSTTHVCHPALSGCNHGFELAGSDHVVAN